VAAGLDKKKNARVKNLLAFKWSLLLRGENPLRSLYSPPSSKRLTRSVDSPNTRKIWAVIIWGQGSIGGTA